MERRASKGPCVDPRDILGDILPHLPSVACIVQIHVYTQSLKTTFLSRLTKYSRVFLEWTGLDIHSPKSYHSPPQNQTVSPCKCTESDYRSSIIYHLSPCLHLLACLVPKARTGSSIRGFERIMICTGKKQWISAWSPDLFGEVGRAGRWSFFGDFERRVAWGLKGPRTRLRWRWGLARWSIGTSRSASQELASHRYHHIIQQALARYALK